MDDRNTFIRTDHEPDTDNSPESNLWNAVLYLFLKDATEARRDLVNSMNGSVAKHQRKLREFREIARHEWLERVCDFAGHEHSSLIKVIDEITEGKRVLELPYRVREPDCYFGSGKFKIKTY